MRKLGAAPFVIHPIHLGVFRQGEPLPVVSPSPWPDTVLVRVLWRPSLPGVTPIVLLTGLLLELVQSPWEAAGLRSIIHEGAGCTRKVWHTVVGLRPHLALWVLLVARASF